MIHLPGLKMRGQGLAPSGGSGRGPVLLPCLASGGLLPALAGGPFLLSLQPLALGVTSPNSSFGLWSSSHRDLGIMFSTHPNNLISRPLLTSASPPCHVTTYSQGCRDQCVAIFGSHCPDDCNSRDLCLFHTYDHMLNPGPFSPVF